MNYFTDWEEQMYLEAIEKHKAMAKQEHLAALGSKDNLTSTMHENNADMHRLFVRQLRKKIEALKEV